MSKYRKKPVVVEAVQWTGENFYELKEFMKDGNIRLGWFEDHLYISKPEENYFVDMGTYIIKGVHGEFYPCKPDIFHKTYEEVSDEG